MELTDKLQCERCRRCMSVEHDYCYCGILPFLKHVFQNFELLTTSAFKIKKRLSRGNKFGRSKEAREHGKAKDAMKNAKNRCNPTILDRTEDHDTYSERMTEQ